MSKKLERLLGHVTREAGARGKPERGEQLGKALTEKLAALKTPAPAGGKK